MSASILKNSSLYTLGSIVPNIVTYLMLPVYTRYLTPADFGIVSLVTTFSTILAIFSNVRLNAGVSIFYFDYDHDGVKKYFSTIFYSQIVLMILFIGLFHGFGDYTAAKLMPDGSLEYFPVLFLGLILVVPNNLTKYLHALLRVREQGWMYFISVCAYTVVHVSFDIWFVVIKKQAVEGILWSKFLSSMALLLILAFGSRIFFAFTYSFKILRTNLAFSIPMIPHAVGTFLFNASDRIVLASFVSASALGLYSMAFKFSLIMQIPIEAIQTALNPEFMRLAKEDPLKAVERFRPIITQIYVFILVLFLGLVFFMDYTVKLATTPAYYGCMEFIPALLGGYIFYGLFRFPMKSILFKKKTIWVPIITLCAGIFNIVGNILLIPYIGAIAAAYTTLLSHAITFLLALWISNRLFPLSYDWRSLGEISLIFLAAFLVIYLPIKSGLLFLSLKLLVLSGVCSILYLRNYGNLRRLKIPIPFLKKSKH